jgi:hypothetical protein
LEPKPDPDLQKRSTCTVRSVRKTGLEKVFKKYFKCEKGRG